MAALHDFERTDEEAGTDVAGLLDGHVEIELGVCGVGCGAAQVLAQTGGSCCGPYNAAGDGFFVREHADAGATRAGRGTGGEDGDDSLHHLALKLLNHSQHGERIFDVPIDAADAVHGVVDAIAGDGREHVHDFFADLEAGHEHGFEAHELGGDAGPEHVRMQALKLCHDDANVLRARRRRLSGQSFHGLAKSEGVDVGADAADALHERNDLNVVASLGQVLDAAKVETDMQLGVNYGFAFADQVQLIGFFECRMVRPHGDFVAHFLTSSCPDKPEAGLLGATVSRRFTPSLSPSRNSSGSYSRPVNSMAKPS